MKLLLKFSNNLNKVNNKSFMNKIKLNKCYKKIIFYLNINQKIK